MYYTHDRKLVDEREYPTLVVNGLLSGEPRIAKLSSASLGEIEVMRNARTRELLT